MNAATAGAIAAADAVETGEATAVAAVPVGAGAIEADPAEAAAVDRSTVALGQVAGVVPSIEARAPAAEEVHPLTEAHAPAAGAVEDRSAHAGRSIADRETAVDRGAGLKCAAAIVAATAALAAAGPKARGSLARAATAAAAQPPAAAGLPAVGSPAAIVRGFPAAVPAIAARERGTAGRIACAEIADGDAVTRIAEAT